jgi:hypothetical protein
MTSAGPNLIDDDRGDRVPGALPARTASTAPRTAGRLVRMAAATGRRTPTRDTGGRRPGPSTGALSRMGRFTRRSLDRFDRYTLEVFNPASPYRPDRSV